MRPKLDWRAAVSGGALCLAYACAAAVPASAHASATDPPPWLSLEHRTIALACRETLSVAELAARVDLPLGVARVLVGDLADQGVVTVHRAPSHAGGPDVALLEQVLQGLQRL